MANGRAGPGLHPQHWWSKESTIKKNGFGRNSSSWGSHTYCYSCRTKETAWTKWESAKDKVIIWSDLKHMESQKLSFLIKAADDISPTPVNLHARGLSTSDWCRACGKTASLKHTHWMWVCSKKLHVET